MANDKEFEEKVRRIGGLVHELESIADPAARAANKELVQLLMDLHGTGLERILEIIFQSGEPGVQVIDELAGDPLVSSLLVLYGLHPDDMPTRVVKKLEQIRPQLRKMGCEVELQSLQEGNLRLRATLEGHTCGSTAKNVHAIVEEAIYSAAPDITTLAIEGLEAPAASGFVALDKLMAVPSSAQVAALSSEGMD